MIEASKLSQINGVSIYWKIHKIWEFWEDLKQKPGKQNIQKMTNSHFYES